MLHAENRNPGGSIHVLTVATGRSRTSCTASASYPFLAQIVQLQQPDDHPLHIRFAHWFINQSVVDMYFANSTLVYDEATLSHEGMLNDHNAHI